MEGARISYIIAFTGGIFTYLSPCLLPLIPSFIAYLTGVSFGELKDAGRRGAVRIKVMTHSLLFILGFSVVFITLGLTATAVGKTLFRYQVAIRTLGGALIIFFGLYLAGIIKLGFLEREVRFRLPVKGATYLGSFLIGVTFAAAWTPCAGPILGSILVLAGTKANVAEGAKLLGVFSLGIAVPFFLTGLATDYFMEYFNRFKKAVGAINVVGGIFLVIVGTLIATGYFSVFAERLLASFTK
jgi:cytochrome c-type biogenesis protein